FQRLAFQHFHGDEVLTFVLVDLVDGADVWMIERGGGASLSFETLQACMFMGKLLGKELQGNEAAEAKVFSLVYHSHAASTELLQDRIVRNRFADHAITAGLAATPSEGERRVFPFLDMPSPQVRGSRSGL